MKHETKLKVGQVVPWKHGEVRVMAIAEGWVMVRRKGAMPFTELEKDLLAFRSSPQLAAAGESR